MMRERLVLVVPYAAWMLLMAVLPATPSAYAVRTFAVSLLLLLLFIPHPPSPLPHPSSPIPHPSSLIPHPSSLLIGLLVFAIWILPEQFDWEWYRRFFIVGEGGTRSVAEASAAMIAIRLLGSALVIPVAEELFFRKWLIDFAGFWWMVGLFAIEHDRWLVGAIAGAVYGLLYLRKGLVAAIVAHAVTNLALGIWVLESGQWQFW